jgi:hypothetical protein
MYFCWIGLHSYPKWTNGEVYKVYTYDDFWNEERECGRAIIQKRYCEGCNKLQTRRQKV